MAIGAGARGLTRFARPVLASTVHIAAQVSAAPHVKQTEVLHPGTGAPHNWCKTHGYCAVNAAAKSGNSAQSHIARRANGAGVLPIIAHRVNPTHHDAGARRPGGLTCGRFEAVGMGRGARARRRAALVRRTGSAGEGFAVVNWGGALPR